MEHISGRINSRRFEQKKAPPARAALLRIGLLVLILIATSAIGYRLGWFDVAHGVHHLSRLRRTHGVATFTIGFVLVFGAGTAIGVPGLPLTVAAGLMFGTFLGTVLSWIGAMIGAAAGYWIARTIGRGVVTRWLKHFRLVDGAIQDSRDFPAMLRLRLIPVLPLGVVNFVGGLARAPFASYLAAAAAGILPATIVYAYFADSLLEETNQGGTRSSLLIASALIIAVSLAPRLVNRLRGRSNDIDG